MCRGPRDMKMILSFGAESIERNAQRSANNAVVARAIGPSLSQAGVTNPLTNPTLELYDSSGALIASNDDWQDTQEAEIMASGLAPSDPNESAIFATLPAGNFTAVVRGADDTTGVALVEVYSVAQ